MFIKMYCCLDYDYYNFGIEEADPGVPLGRPTGTHVCLFRLLIFKRHRLAVNCVFLCV